MYISRDPIGLLSGQPNFYAYVSDANSILDIFGLAGGRWKNKKTKNGDSYKKPGPKAKGTGDHNAKIEEIINRETAKPGVEHIGGGNIEEITIDTKGGVKDTRRMDTSFEKANGDIYHVNVGKSLDDGLTGIIREREALEDAINAGKNVTFESYGKDKDYRNGEANKKKKKNTY